MLQPRLLWWFFWRRNGEDSHKRSTRAEINEISRNRVVSYIIGIGGLISNSMCSYIHTCLSPNKKHVVHNDTNQKWILNVFLCVCMCDRLGHWFQYTSRQQFSLRSELLDYPHGEYDRRDEDLCRTFRKNREQRNDAHPKSHRYVFFFFVIESNKTLPRKT